MERGDKVKIAKWLGLKKSFFYRICTGEKRPGAARSSDLEKISGISMRNWQLMPIGELLLKIDTAYQAHAEKQK